MMNKFFLYLSFLIAVFLFSCKEKRSETVTKQEVKTEIYTCPMHPQIIRDKPGNCPICGMELVKKEMNGQEITTIDLNTLLKPTNSFVVSSIPVTTIQQGAQEIEIDALGTV